ncbi:hypothetical protein DV515_00007629 [Chloebia gouldiae]|uniref:Peptidase S72 domain-containing protein n=1 Tax=Chloebia gouldiae TaxID=44316 RepID=A0A3L8SGP5_CHLGU|nr:hypothetical protein DV515_00007629 [Chloebia gouldiae]
MKTLPEDFSHYLLLPWTAQSGEKKAGDVDSEKWRAPVAAPSCQRCWRRMEDACRDPGHTQHSPPASWSPVLPGLRVLPLLPLLFALLSACVSCPAEAAKGLNNRWEETKSLQGVIPDTTVLMGKIFYYPVPAFAFQGMITQYKVFLASGADLPKWLEFNPEANTLQGLPMAGEGGMYLLNLAASGGLPAQETLRAAGNFTIHVQDSSLSLEMQNLKHLPNSYQCGKEAPITCAEIILSAAAAALAARERLSVVCRMAEYLHLDSSLLTLLQHTDPAARGCHVLAEDTRHINLTTNNYVGLSWPVTCGGFALLHEFIQVLQHNMDSHHLSRLLGYEIAGWRILRRGEYERKSPRLHRRQLMITPTPALKPTRITQRPAAGETSRPLFFPVPSQLLTPLVLSLRSTQSLSTFCAESITMASYKMQNIHLASQESLVTLEMDSAQDMPTNPTVSIMFADSHFPDLSPSLMTETRLLFSELEVLPARVSGTSLLSEQPEPHVPEAESYFLSSESEISTYHLLQDVTSGTEQLSRSSRPPFPPAYSSSMLRTEPQPTRILPSGTEELLSDKDLGTSGILTSVTEPTLESHNILGIKPDAVEAPLVTLFNATSHLPSSIPEMGETLLPSHLDPSTQLFPSSERLQFLESAWILPSFSAPPELQIATQGQANTSPKVVHSIKFLTATIGCLFFFPIPANTFYDKEDGNSSHLSLQILPADSSPWGSESWLQFNTSQQAMHGYPLEMDFQHSPQEFVLSATDSSGLTAWQSFTIELLKPPQPPCHLFTVRTKNSYSSFLRERKRVGLFLEKLSFFLNSSSPKDVALTGLQPGSTLISWYNSSLCASANTSSSWCRKDETQQALEKLRVPAGSVSPQFIQAMLPEYRIDVTFSISYSEDCPASTKPLQAKNDSTASQEDSWSTACAGSDKLPAKPR